MFRECIVLLFTLVAGFSAINCKFNVKLQQDLLNEGFHRSIRYIITFDSLNKQLFDNCLVGLHQVLPGGVFANPDQLRDLKRLQKLFVVPMNLVNVELPAEESRSTSVFIINNLRGEQATTWLPVHARYHRATSEGGYAYNQIQPPHLFLRCVDERLDQCERAPAYLFPCDGSSKEKCAWRHIPTTVLTKTVVFGVPVGNTSAYYLVTSVTCFVVVAGSLYLLKTLHEYKMKKT